MEMYNPTSEYDYLAAEYGGREGPRITQGTVTT